MASKSTKKPAASSNKGNAKSSIVPFAAPQPLESMEKIMSTSKNQFEKFKTEASVSGGANRNGRLGFFARTNSSLPELD